MEIVPDDATDREERHGVRRGRDREETRREGVPPSPRDDERESEEDGVREGDSRGRDGEGVRDPVPRDDARPPTLVGDRGRCESIREPRGGDRPVLDRDRSRLDLRTREAFAHARDVPARRRDLLGDRRDEGDEEQAARKGEMAPRAPGEFPVAPPPHDDECAREGAAPAAIGTVATCVCATKAPKITAGIAAPVAPSATIAARTR